MLLPFGLQDPRGFIAKLSDFGLSMKMAAHDGQVPGIKYGTVQYLAPEVLNTHIMTKKADVYSFGIIMWEVWHSRLFAEFYNNEKRKRKQYASLFCNHSSVMHVIFYPCSRYVGDETYVDFLLHCAEFQVCSRCTARRLSSIISCHWCYICGGGLSGTNCSY